MSRSRTGACWLALALACVPAAQAGTGGAGGNAGDPADSAAAVDAAAAACRAGPTGHSADPRLPALLAEARSQHRQFGGQRIDADGRLVKSGQGEADTSRAAGEPRGDPAWLRVERFWKSWRPDAPAYLRDGAGRFQRTDLLLQALQMAGTARLNSFGGDLRDLGLSQQEIDTLGSALRRAALIDMPWSAVFISHLARQAGFGPDEFHFSDAHADYARAALQQTRDEAAGRPGRHAWRACDATRTAPRPGDLLCHARARAAGLDGFAALASALQDGRGLPMHCDLVVRVDPAALRLEAIGGNVLQSVTLRELQLQPPDDDAGGPLLPAARYRLQAGAPEAGFNDQPWVLLLQLR